MTDNYNSSKDPQTDTDDWTGDRTAQELYEEGIKYFKASNFFLFRNIQGSYAFHDVYVIGSPLEVKGVNYPKTFKVLLPLTEADDIDKLQRLILDKKGDDIEFFDFWKPVVYPDYANRKPIYGYTANLVRADREGRKVRSGQPFDLGISTNPEPGQLPIKWVPRTEWFDKSLQDVELEDVFTIFPEAERNLLELIIGRLVVGRTNNIHKDGTIVRHTSRMAAVIVGFDPGTGKSTLFTYLNDAIGKCGYRQSTFRSLKDRFNLSSTISADWAYKDDVSNDSFKSFLKSEAAKIIITGGQMRTEQKGIDAVDEFAHCTVFLNTNSYDPRTVFEIDPGTADRIKLLQTYSEGELRRLKLTGPSEGTPNVKPFNHLPWLAEKLDVSVDALMLWVTRKAADLFWETIHTESVEHNPLEMRVRDLSGQLKLILSKDSTRQVLMYLFFCHMLAGRIPIVLSKTKLTSLNWSEAFLATQSFIKSSDCGVIRKALKEHWLKHNRPSTHPYPGMVQLNHSTLGTAGLHWQESSFKSLGINVSERFRKVFGSIHLKSGFRLGCDLVWMTREWELCGSHFESLKDLALECSKLLSPAALDRLCKAASGIDEEDWE